ncbi:MAG: DNA repair protein RecN [Candidatus Aminicenantes bacterium RBG_19FT_COMBO_58_17]|nr:MAG: DNA repair protein RecN [Candidatus Aminicenantes bacterium RBG_19FT_COMBO_58_17]HCS47127.1 DNA repair protein RecN [Candidatus Aminicenantes bacterium]
MLGSLHIKNLATIEDLEIHFQEGFSILTGETGAGKSIIIDGIKLVLGDKASPDLIRTGRAEATIEAVFRLPPPKGVAADPSLSEEGEVFIQRHITQDGTGKAYLNGVLVPAKKLKEVSPFLVDIYGQNDHIFLLQIENHLRYLDDFLGLGGLREEVARVAQDLRRLSRQQGELEARKREREQRLDFLGFQIKEIEAAGLHPGEWEELLAERNILKNSEKVALLVEAGLGCAYSDEGSVSAGLSKLQEVVRELARFDQGFEAYDDSLGQSAIAVRELADALIRFKDRQSLGPERLEELEARLSTIEKLRRKYGETIEDILRHCAKAKQESDDLARSEETLAGLEAEISQSLRGYKAKAERLSRLRHDGSPRLQDQVEKEIALLGMRKARFQVKLETAPLDALAPETARELGLDEVEFLISPNPGEDLRPLRKVASGGELSRIMLALKTIGKEKDLLKTLIFDEIDSGIGGKTAECIASKLRDLARRHQVICITHLPQIASFAPHHYRIEKTVARERTFTTVQKLGFEERVSEISRLLSGSRMTATSLQNAREMLHLNLEQEKTKRRNA